MYKITIMILVVILISGCETLGGAWTKKSSIAFVKDSGGSLSIWNAEMSAAVAYETGQICMQRALAVKTIDAKTSVKISDAMLALAQTSQTVASSGDKDALISVSNSLKETAKLLTTSTERTTYLDLGMFYTCQISANGGLTDTQTAELIKILVISGAAINTTDVNATLKEVGKMDITAGEKVREIVKSEMVLIEEIE